MSKTPCLPMSLSCSCVVAFALALALAAGGCGGDEAAEPGTHPDGPQFLAFGANQLELVGHDDVVISAVLTDPQGVADVVGGTLALVGAQGQEVILGAFSTSAQEGAYSISLDGIDLLASHGLTTGLMLPPGAAMTLRATFFDAAGHASYRELALQVWCFAFKMIVGLAPLGHLEAGQCVFAEGFPYNCGCPPEAGSSCIDGDFICVTYEAELTLDEVCAVVGGTCGACNEGSACDDLGGHNVCRCER